MRTYIIIYTKRLRLLPFEPDTVSTGAGIVDTLRPCLIVGNAGL